jgi:hypothetical protein
MKKLYYRKSKTVTGVPRDRNGVPMQKLGYQTIPKTKPIKQNKKLWRSSL